MIVERVGPAVAAPPTLRAEVSWEEGGAFPIEPGNRSQDRVANLAAAPAAPRRAAALLRLAAVECLDRAGPD